MENSQILDSNLDANNIPDVEKNIASGGKRFANLVIDYIVYYATMFVFGIIIGITQQNDLLVLFEGFTGGLISISIFMIYLITFESLFGKTVGKFITKTRVVSLDGSQPDFLNIVGRAFSRLIPFEAFSFLGNRPVGWHDSLSKTRVIND